MTTVANKWLGQRRPIDSAITPNRRPSAENSEREAAFGVNLTTVPARHAGGHVPTGPPTSCDGHLRAAVQETIRRAGRPLGQECRAAMGARFGHDFGDVRIHTDAIAAASAEAVQARAYTVGNHVVIGAGQPSLETTAGQQLLAHELTHVVQQSHGGVGPAQSASGAHEREADSAKAALVSGPQHIPVQSVAGVGLARQPKATNSADIDIENLLTTPSKQGITDPRSSARYIDRLFETVGYSGFTGASVFHWTEGGKKKTVGVPLADLDQDDSKSFAPILDIYNSKAEATKVVQAYLASTFTMYTFYRTADNVIMPTIFCIQSTPEFHRIWPALKKELAQDAEDTRRALVPWANIVNPIPGTRVDDNGNFGLSDDPLDWLPFFHMGHEWHNLHEVKEGGPATRRLHSGYGVQYTVLGPHEKLTGTSVYVLKDAEGVVLYVGKGEALDRLREHIKDPLKTQWFGEIAQVEVRATGLNNTEALALEQDLIGQLGPQHNRDRTPFKTAFGTAMEVGPNLPRAQATLRFWLEWGH